MTSFDVRARVGAILATLLPLGGCGTNQQNVGPCDGNCSVCPYTPFYYDASYVECVDSGDDASVPSGCFSTCTQACIASKPADAPCKNNIGICSTQCTVTSEGAGLATATCNVLQICGRRTTGLRAPRFHDGGDALADYLARAAWLEAASVQSFRRLARELAHYGAPTTLVNAARSAARDEVRHARVMTDLAHRYGGSVPEVVVEHNIAPRTLEAVAAENAVEACVRETYGALAAAWQAATAKDSAIREAMSFIARDELRHAELGFEIAAWCESRLDRDATDRITAARREAMQTLLREARFVPSNELIHAAGVPSARDARLLVEHLFEDAA